MKSISVQTRIQLRNVLYCTDLSPSASSALPQAVALARHFGRTRLVLRASGANQLILNLNQSWIAEEQNTDRHSNSEYGFGERFAIVC
jgi:hypothetical protein